MKNLTTEQKLKNRRAAGRKYYHAHKEQALVYRLKNKDKISARRKIYDVKPETIARIKKYREDNKEHIRKNAKIYAGLHKEDRQIYLDENKIHTRNRNHNYTVKNVKYRTEYLGVTNCPKCGKHGYLYCDQNYNKKTKKYFKANYKVRHVIRRKNPSINTYCVLKEYIS